MLTVYLFSYGYVYPRQSTSFGIPEGTETMSTVVVIVFESKTHLSFIGYWLVLRIDLRLLRF